MQTSVGPPTLHSLQGDEEEDDAQEQKLQNSNASRKDRVSLTLFPVPGSMSPSSAAPLFKVLDDPNDKDQPQQEQPDQATRPATLPKKEQYWMPDHLCRVCYECGLAFSLFRRRHHCRLCGQIFCFECSDHFINGESHGFSGMIRVCNFCYKYTNNLVPCSSSSASGSPVQAPPVSSSSTFSERHQQPNEASSEVDLTADLLSSSATQVKNSDSSDAASSLGEPEELEPHLSSRVTSNSKISSAITSENPQAPPSERVHPRKRASAELLGAIASAREVLEQEAAMNSPEKQQLASPPKEFTTLPPVSHSSASIAMIRKQIALMAEPFRLDLEDADVSVNHLVQDLESMSLLVARSILPSSRFLQATGFNFASLIKIKSIASTPFSETALLEYVAGPVFRKNVCHKQMPRHINNPRILLLAGGISYDRAYETERMSSLELLMDQEKSYVMIQVQKICTLRPDVIFVGKTVSRYAQELLTDRGVALVTNVKKETLDSISRHTGAQILVSTDHLTEMEAEQVLGTCRTFSVKTVEIQNDGPPPLCIASESFGPFSSMSSSVARVPKSGGVIHESKSFHEANSLRQMETHQLRGSYSFNNLSDSARNLRSRNATETYIYLDGCDILNGCTVVVSGVCKSALREIKKLVRSVFFMAYQELLEARLRSTLDAKVASSPTTTPSRNGGMTTAPGYRMGIKLSCTACQLRIHDTSHSKQRYTHCSAPREVEIPMYCEGDISLGKYLADEIASLTKRCTSPKCQYLMADHVLTYTTPKGSVLISFEELPEGQQALCAMAELARSAVGGGALNSIEEDDISQTTPIVYWRWCRECNILITPLTRFPDVVHRFSLARLLQIVFTEQLEIVTTSDCSHNPQTCHVMFFSIGKSVARIDYLKRFSVRVMQFNTNSTSTTATRRGIQSNSHPPSPVKSSAKSSHVDKVQQAFVLMRDGEVREMYDKVVDAFDAKMEEIKSLMASMGDGDSKQRLVLMELVSLRTILRMDQTNYQHDFLDSSKPNENVDSVCKHHQPRSIRDQVIHWDLAQRALYTMACKWLEQFLKLGLYFKTTAGANVSANSRSNKTTPLANSNPLSPKLASLSASPSSTTSAPAKPKTLLETLVDQLPSVRSVEGKDDSSNTNSINDPNGDEQGATIVTSHDASSDEIPNEAAVEETPSAWRVALGELFGVLGRNTVQTSFKVELPTELLGCFATLPCPNDHDSVVLVSESVPVTMVAFALRSNQYEQSIDEMKVQLHSEAANAAAKIVESPLGTKMGPVSTNWVRAVLNSQSVTTSFKFSTTHLPLHTRVLLAKASSSAYVSTYDSSSSSSSSSSSDSASVSYEITCVAHYPLQFEVLRELFFGHDDEEYTFALAHAKAWAACGGKSGARFFRSFDDRLVAKHISQTEMQSFLEVLPAYFKYLATIHFDGVQSLLSKVLGLYQTSVWNKETGQKTTCYISVTENAFYDRAVEHVYDLKGSSRNRYIKQKDRNSPRRSPRRKGMVASPTSSARSTPTATKVMPPALTRTMSSSPSESGTEEEDPIRVLLDGNFLEVTRGIPLAMEEAHHKRFVEAIKNDTNFLSSINIVDYSMIVGFGEYKKASNTELFPTQMAVGIIDYLRQFDLIKRMESVGKSVGMIAGQASPTIIEPSMYSKRFSDAMQRYFMPVSE